MPTAQLRSSTKRWRRANAPAIARSKLNCIGRAAKCCCKRDPANPAPAEEAFLTAIAVAKQQGTRSFELRAALSLAKLYQSTGRPAEAHAVLAPALEGFAPTPEMPEIAEAQALLAALTETDEVKAAGGAGSDGSLQISLRPCDDRGAWVWRAEKPRPPSRAPGVRPRRQCRGALRSRPRSVGSAATCEANCASREDACELGFLRRSGGPNSA